MRTTDTKHLQNMLGSFAPNESFIDYNKLINLVKHQIKEYEKTQKIIEENPTYYVLQDPQALKDYKMLDDKIEEWEWLLEILTERYEILTFDG